MTWFILFEVSINLNWEIKNIWKRILYRVWIEIIYYIHRFGKVNKALRKKNFPITCKSLFIQWVKNPNSLNIIITKKKCCQLIRIIIVHDSILLLLPIKFTNSKMVFILQRLLLTLRYSIHFTDSSLTCSAMMKPIWT